MAADSEQVVARFRQLVSNDRQADGIRSLASYQRLFHGSEELIAREYARLVEDERSTPPQPVEPPSATDSLLRKLKPGDGGLAQEGEIARGGMGAIKKVRDEALHRDLAMKVMLPDRESDAIYVHRFLEEAQVTAQLDHPGVVPVHQLGRAPDGRLYFTMKLVKGRTLSRIFDLVRNREANWTNTRALELFIRICETLAFAHQKGVVHRDLKPANVMVGSYGEVYVMDWGLAKVVGERAEPADSRKTPTPEPQSMVKSVRSSDSTEGHSSPTATVAGDVLGTPTYMPLEQAMGTELDARSDVYAIGAMIYELFAGQPPYSDKERSAHGVLVAVVAGPPTPLRTLKPKLPAEMLAICEKAMARDPADRYQSAGELAQELRNFIEGRVVDAYRTGALVSFRKWVMRNKALATAIGAAVVLLVLGLVTNRSLYHEALRESERNRRQAYRAAVAAAASEIENNNLAAAEARLDALPGDLRGWEWRHLRGRVDTSVRLPVRPAAFEARTGRLLCFDEESSRGLEAYDLDTGARTEIVPRDVLDTEDKPFLTADGRYCRVRLPNGDRVVRDLHTDRVVVSPDGKLDEIQPWFHTEDGRTIELATGEPVTPDAATALSNRLMENPVELQGAYASPDRTKVAYVRDNTVAMFDVATGKRVGETITLDANPLCRAWSPASALFAVGTLGVELVVVDAATGRIHRDLLGHSGWVGAAAFSPDGALLATGGLDGGRIWDMRGAVEPRVLRGHKSFVYPVAFSPDGQRIVSGGWDGYAGAVGSLRLWDAATGQQIVATSRAPAIWWARYMPDGRHLLVAFRETNGLRVLDADTLEVVRTLGYGESVALSPDGTRVAAGDHHNKVCRVIDTTTGAVLAKLPTVQGTAAYGDRWIATTKSPASMVLWNAKTFEREREIPSIKWTTRIAFEPNGTRIVAARGVGGSAWVIDGVTKERLAVLPGHGSEVLCVRFSPDGSRILIGGRDGNIHIWDAESYEEIVQLRGHTAYVYSMDRSPDGEMLVSGSGDGTVRIWETEPITVRQLAIAERERLVAELRPRVQELFEQLEKPNAVVERLRGELKGRRREVALQLALAEAVARRDGR
jgi:WD40 repeat protein/tRNA A-37 threonylcarbamoyl transferase component Bud32